MTAGVVAVAGIIVPAAGVLWVLNLWLGDHALVLSYARALVWPAVAASALVWLRVPIRRKIDNVMRASFRGAELVFAATEEFARDIMAPAALLAGADGGTPADEEPPSREADDPAALLSDDGRSVSHDRHLAQTDTVTLRDSPTATVAAQPAEADGETTANRERQTARERADAAAAEAERRVALETVIRESAQFGYRMAGHGFTTAPVPRVRWTSDGAPAIDFTVETPEPMRWKRWTAGILTPHMSQRDSATRARELEEEIRRLEEEHTIEMLRGAGMGPKAMARSMTIDRMKKRLAIVDPQSPYLD